MDKLVLLVFVATLVVGCQSQADDDQPTEPPDQEVVTDDDEDIVAEEDEKINDDSDLSGEGEMGCPEPKEPEGMCAQVITWALTPEGACCEYPTPCHVPDDLETFNSEEACLEAAEDDGA